MKVVADFFAFITLVAVLMVVIAALNHPDGISAVLKGFNNILGNLKDTPSGTVNTGFYGGI